MTRKQADEFMNKKFDYYADKAQTDESEEKREHYTDEAHKLYITLASAGAFESEPEQGFNLRDGDTEFKS